ncbi:MAG: hypothetical protein HYT31_01940 [Parcubacteria group bacterium]|nr:hypothetical protein [Parcubacteria group bacterium]
MFKPILDEFIGQFKRKHPKDNIRVLAMLGFGSSFSNKKIRANSDLDLYIVIKDIGKRFRGVMRINGIAVDYFAYPLKQLKADWKKVKNRTAPRLTIAYMLRDGHIILDQNHALRKLRIEAKKFLQHELKNSAIPPNLLVINKYFVNDYLKDIEDSLRDGDAFAWQYNVNLLFKDLIDIFCQFHKIPLVKPKYQKMEIAKRDKKFVRLYESVAGAPSPKEKTKRINALARYCLKTMGGPLPREWELARPVRDV